MSASPLSNNSGRNTKAQNSRRKPVSRIGSMAWLTCAAAENDAAINKAHSSMLA
jgi:hypothetical protein